MRKFDKKASQVIKITDKGMKKLLRTRTDMILGIKAGIRSLSQDLKCAEGDLWDDIRAHLDIEDVARPRMNYDFVKQEVVILPEYGSELPDLGNLSQAQKEVIKMNPRRNKIDIKRTGKK